MKKSKTRLFIIIIAIYLIGIVWISAYIYNNCLQENYTTAFWLTELIHFLGIYIAAAHFFIHGKDK